MAKMGLIAYPMQNSVRNMIGTLVFMCGGLIMSKLRILDGPPSWDFNLVRKLVWRGIQITYGISQKFQKHYYSTCSG